MRIYLIRHAMTPGNLKRRFIGRTDEPLSEEGKELLKSRTYPQADIVFASPMQRCIQSAQIIYPEAEIHTVSDLKECDFGLFENHSDEELSGMPAYEAWISTGRMDAFPEGESVTGFKARSVSAFEDCLFDCLKHRIDSAAFVVHGGSIMSIMEAYGDPTRTYYEYQVKNGDGYELFLTDDPAGTDRICSGSDPGRPGVAAASGAHLRPSDQWDGKNYKKLFS